MPLSEGEIAIGWLGQSGFAFRDPKGTVLAIDVYLTNSAERVWGLKRLMAPVISPEEFAPDILVATHFHEDHLDIDAMPTILNNGKTKLLTPGSSIARLKEISAPTASYEQFDTGDFVVLKGITLEGVYADHGEYVPDPVGVIVEMQGIKIYFCGDTAYRPDSMQKAISCKPEIVIPPINGANGNMNSEEAAILTEKCEAKTVIPCHFWTFAEHLGNPQSFKEAMAKHASKTDVLMMCQGEVVKYIGRK
jgi:L-ascorbate 6-phosphate lactonase